jgi:biopolymer transport protein ExbD
MAGSQNIGESSDNPVAINVTAMVDVIFCLCIFFMCSFHFKQLEGKIESWLPRGSAGGPAAADKSPLEDIRVVLTWDAGRGVTSRQVGNRPPVTSDEELMRIVLSMAADYKKVGREDFPVQVQSGRDVPWQDVVHVLDILKRRGLERIEFAASS